MHSNNDLMDPNWRPTPSPSPTPEIEAARDEVIYAARLVAKCECYREGGVKVWHPGLIAALEKLDKALAV